jgi:hydroxymethylbilane synthase
MAQKLIIGSRGSALALAQSYAVAESLRAVNQRLTVEVKIIRTLGDELAEASLVRTAERGLFVKRIQEALRQRSVDLAVHSAKDLPVEIAAGLALAAVPPRADPRDVLMTLDGLTLAQLPAGAIIGTSSPRRSAQLLQARPDLEITPLRGNLDSRITKLQMKRIQGIVIALAGLERLHRANEATEILPYSICLPAVGQGALAIECRADDREALRAAARIDDPPSRQALLAERALLAGLRGGCLAPIGGLATHVRDGLSLEGLVISPDGRRMVRHTLAGPAENAEALGRRLAQYLLEQGGSEILAEARTP